MTALHSFPTRRARSFVAGIKRDACTQALHKLGNQLSTSRLPQMNTDITPSLCAAGLQTGGTAWLACTNVPNLCSSFVAFSRPCTAFQGSFCKPSVMILLLGF